jgi:hypothetical protein
VRVAVYGTLTTLEDMWLPLVDDMTDCGFRMIAVDRPGQILSKLPNSSREVFRGHSILVAPIGAKTRRQDVVG